MAYMTAMEGLSSGIPRTWPTKPVVDWSPKTRYPMGIASSFAFMTWMEPMAWAPMMK